MPKKTANRRAYDKAYYKAHRAEILLRKKIRYQDKIKGESNG